jgi:cytoskeleton protein RodZ
MNAEAGGAAAAAESGSPGELLRKQRERRALSVQQAAEHLHLDASMIEAIEADRFQVLGPPVYAKGHLRKYAMLLGLSPMQVIQQYEALSGTPVVPTPVPASAAVPFRRERRSLKVPLLIVLALVLLVLGWWVYKQLIPPTTELPVAPSGQVAPPAIEPGASSATAVETAPATTAPVSTAAASQPVAMMTTVGGSNTRAAASGRDVELTLEFSAASWTEIYDAAGNRLMFETGASGLTRTVRGVPPLRVTLGFASAVNARVNGKAIVIPRQAGKDAAKFAIAAGGTVR